MKTIKMIKIYYNFKINNFHNNMIIIQNRIKLIILII
jgi:hypothetical protein